MNLPWYLKLFYGLRGLTVPGSLKNAYDVFKSSPSLTGNSGSNLLSDIFGIGNIFDLTKALTNRITAEHMTGADREAAELSYHQQEQFFNDYQSIPAQVQQSVDAGLNPALMYGKGATPMSPISGNASASSASLDPVSMLTGLVGLGFQAKELKANLALKGAEANLKNAQADMTRKNIDAFAERLERERGRFKIDYDVAYKNIDEIDSRIAINAVEKDLKSAQIDKVKAETDLAKWQSDLAKIDVNSRSRLNSLLCELRQAEINMKNAETGRIKQEVDYYSNIAEDRVNKFHAEMEKMVAEGKISKNDAEYWFDSKNLETISVITQAYANTRDEFKSFIAGWSKHSNHNMKEIGLFPDSFNIGSYYRP